MEMVEERIFDLGEMETLLQNKGKGQRPKSPFWLSFA